MQREIEIHPETKVGELLEAYPELEDVLRRAAPAFAQLRNPVLRRTVARVTTLRRVAGIGGVELRDLIRTLRASAGLPPGAEASGAAAETDAEASDTREFDVDPSVIVATIDADAQLASGNVPLQTILALAEDAQAEEFIRVESSFAPTPLIDAVRRAGFRCGMRQSGPRSFEALIGRTLAPRAAPAR